MRRPNARTGPRWRSIALLAILIGSAVGCRKKPAAPAPPPAQSPVELPAPTPTVPPSDSAAAPAAERTLAMFQLGLTYATGQPPVQDRKRAREVFEELIALYPESELRPHAELILQLLAQLETLQDANRSAERQIQQLNEKLEQLKKIDMGPRPP